MRDLILLRVLVVWMLNQLLQHLNHVVGVQSWHPGILQGLGADLAGVGFDIWMINFCDEFNLWTFERIVIAVVHIYHKFPSLVWGSFGAIYDDMPLGDVVVLYRNFNPWNWVFVEVT